MTWQIALFLYLILGTATFLGRRSLATHFAEHSRLVNAFAYAVFLVPLGFGVALVTAPDLNIGWLNIALLMVVAVIFPLATLSAFQASREMDAGSYSVFANASPLISIVLATLWLHEGLNTVQAAGAFLILLAALIVTLPQLERRIIKTKKGLLYGLGAVTLFGIGVVYERFMLSRIDVGAYMAYGWTMQAVVACFIAWPERHDIPLLLSRRVRKVLISFCTATSLRGLFFVVALSLATNASVVMAFSSFLPVLVVLGGYIFLGERKWLALKLGAAALGVAGLVLLELA